MTNPEIAAAPCRHKLVLGTTNREQAARTAAALTELLDPPADAVSIFEVTGGDTSAPPSGWRVDAYFQESPDASAIADLVSDLTGIDRPDLMLETVPDENWVTLSQAALPPVTAGRFTVHGSHDRARVVRGPWSILIDAGEAFGTAHHATTQGCLLAVDRITRQQRHSRVLDLGCGSGVLAIAAQRALPRARVLASDIDPIAATVARANARANGVASIRTVVGNGVPKAGGASGVRHDLVIANILARPLVLLAGSIGASVVRRGTLVLSGLLTSQAREVQAAYLARGFSLMRHDMIAGWSTLTLVKR